MFLTIKEAINSYKKGCREKCEMSFGMTLGKSFFAGIMIALGAAGSSVAAYGVGNVGLARLTAAVVFPVGLMMVILMGAELFTGDCLLVIGLPFYYFNKDRKESKTLELIEEDKANDVLRRSYTRGIAR